MIKTKLLILLVGASLLSVACKRDVEKPNIVPDGEQVIALSSGVALSRTANIGNRIVFETGDQIGVISMFSHYADKTVQWDTTCHFENAPAAFESNNELTPTVTTFGWGPAAEGGRTWSQYYPSRKREIFVYAYYPYVAKGEGSIYVPLNPEATTDAERQPKLNITLVSGPIVAGGVDDVLVKQPDILHYAGFVTPTAPAPAPAPPVVQPPVSSASLLPNLVFKHTLAQVAFKIKRPIGSSPCKFVSMTMKTTAKATLNLADGLYTCETPSADGSNRQDAVYTITMADSCTRIIPESIDVDHYLDVLNSGRKAAFNYLMILPLTAVDAELGEMVLSCDFGVGATKDIRDFKIATSGLIQNFVAGKLNTITLTVSLSRIDITASIATWGEGNDMEFPAE